MRFAESEVTEGRASELATEHEGDSTALGTDTEKGPDSAPGANPVFSQNGVLSDSGAGPLIICWIAARAGPRGSVQPVAEHHPSTSATECGYRADRPRDRVR